MFEQKAPATVPVQGIAVPVVECKGQRVVTFAIIDAVHKRPEGTARRTFQANRSRFIENEDFYVLDSISLNEFRTHGIFGESAQHGMVLTESGYLMLVKSFTDDLAWDVQRALVKCYFRAPRTQPADFDAVLSDPASLRGLLLVYTEKVLALEETVREQAPKVAFHDAVTEAENAQTMRDAAKVLGTGQNRLFGLLRSRGILMRDNRPYQRYIDAGYFRVVERVHEGRGMPMTYTKTLVTGKGLAYLQKQLAASP